jgi:cation diffusion facilitator CzcD-associated flavoprotein CzcO
MMTLGFPFEPWTDPDAIADGPKILDYLRRTADRHGITERVRLGHKVVAADWSSDEALWTVTVEHGGARRQLTCGFLYLCSGYYDYDRPHDPQLPGLETFEGQVVHPQFWPDDLDVTGRKVVVIGSGATAVTLVPSLAEAGADVTMLQRTPTWIASLPRQDRVRDVMQKVLPARAAGTAARYKNVLGTMGVYELSRRRPAVMKSLLSKGAAKSLGSTDLVADHFTPTYDPWDQRLCVVPDGDLFEAVRSGRAHVVTGTIETFEPHGIRLHSGHELEADIVVTATGLRIKLAGGIAITVDGEARATGDLTVYRGLMFAGVPNLAVCVGYVNASWTLRADLASRYVCRLLNHMDAEGYVSATPVAPPEGASEPFVPLTSGYIQRSLAQLPRQASRAPWRVYQNYFLDRRIMGRGRLDDEGMTFQRAGERIGETAA